MAVEVQRPLLRKSLIAAALLLAGLLGGLPIALAAMLDAGIPLFTFTAGLLWGCLWLAWVTGLT